MPLVATGPTGPNTGKLAKAGSQTEPDLLLLTVIMDLPLPRPCSTVQNSSINGPNALINGKGHVLGSDRMSPGFCGSASGTSRTASESFTARQRDSRQHRHGNVCPGLPETEIHSPIVRLYPV
jgi:hypothetical protein